MNGASAANNAEHLQILWGSLAGCTTLLVGVVGIMYHRINKDIEGESRARDKGYSDIQARLDLGVTAFTTMGKELVQLGQQIIALEKEDTYQGTELDRLELDIKILVKQLTILETEHKHCKENP